MNLRDKILVAIYVGTEGISDPAEYVEKVGESFMDFFEAFDDVATLVIPAAGTTSIKIDYINPILLIGKSAEKKYAEMEESIDKLKKSIDSFLGKTENKK